ncbi:hypothetical protein U7865_003242 [Salmonella enterica]|nr:hypothetical protein [Salmonella enterica]EMB1923809.1 hypothetical protein [Salmonella enterica]
MKLYEMEGFLRGKCIPGDLKVNETNAEYLVRKFSEAEEKCAAMTAENAGLKAAIDSTIGWQQSTDPVNVESVRMLVDIETPATDAFLAEVRAQGADELAELYFTLAAHEANRYIADSWRESARFAKDYAVQIRKGAAQ